MFHQLKLVTWKNLKVRKRHWFLTIVQVVIAIALFLFLVYARSKVDTFSKRIINTTTVYEPDVNWNRFWFANDGTMRLWYSPINEMTETIVEGLKNDFTIAGQYAEGFKSEDEILHRYAQMSNVTAWALVFDTKDPKQLRYKIREHSQEVWSWHTEELHDMMARPDMGNIYSSQHFLALQYAVDKAFIEYHSKKKLDVKITVQEFPYPPHKEDSMLTEIFATYLPVFTLFSFIFICPAVLKRVAEEKATGIKELLKMNGMKPALMLVGWYIHAFTADLISIIIIVILLKVPFFGAELPLIEYCDGLVLFLFLFLYVVAAIASCFFIAALLNNPSISMIAGLLFWILSYVIPDQIMTSHPYMKWCYKMLFGLFPNIALKHGYTAISVYESRDVGVSWSNLHLSASNSSDDVTMLNSFTLLIFDTFLYLTLTIYVDNINPGQYGVPKPIHYPILAIKRTIYKLWRKKSCDSRITNDEVTALNDIEANGQLPSKERCIEVENLCKKFGHVNAVESLYFNIRRNVITVLLGHNGAGKTTTMSIITGMIPATSGRVKVNGVDIKKNRDKVQEQLGLCPQHNLVFPDLTVREHLIFFATLKGASFADAGMKTDKLLTRLNMFQKKESLAATLSGGMKRKLCLAMAMVGDSKVLILDEPTSGMDPESRRKFWDLLKNDRKNRTILITTHFMDEAEALADEIVIMSHGKVLTQGTPMKLKTDYKTGYHFTVYLKDDANEDKVVDIMKESGLREFERLHRIDNAVTFKLSLQEQNKYPELFNKLELAKQESIVTDFSLKLNTLTDVFIKSKAIEDAKNVIKPTNNEQISEPTDASDALGEPSFQNSINSLMLKRVYFMGNKYRLYIPSFLIMLGIMILVIILGQPSDSSLDESKEPLALHLATYGQTGVVFGGPDYPENPNIARIKSIYKSLVQEQGSDPLENNDVISKISDLGVENIAYYKQHMVAGASFDLIGGALEVIGMFSSTAIHSPPIALNLVTNAVAKLLLGSDYSIATMNAPLPTINSNFTPEQQNAMNVVMLWMFLVPIGSLLLIANFVIFPNAERVTNFVQVQYVCGIQPVVYWLSNFLVDLTLCVIQFGIITLVIVLISSLYEPNIFHHADISTIFTIFFAYSVGAVPFSYIFSYRKTLTGAFSLFIIIGLFSGVIPTVIVTVMELSGDEFYEKIGTGLRHLFMCTCPQFSLTYNCIQFSHKYIEIKNWLGMDKSKRQLTCLRSPNPCCLGDGLECENYKSYYSKDGANLAPNILEMSLATGLIYFTLLCMLDSIYVKKIKNMVIKFAVEMIKRFRNDPITPGRGGVEEGDGREIEHNTDSLRANKLKKSYGFTTVVNGVSFNLTKGQCFGLLGVNGAGKSTTFKMLTREELFDDGSIKLLSGQQEIEIFNKDYLKKIGYCPQQNALNFALTGRQLLQIVGMMRGYSMEDAQSAAKIYLKKFELDQYADRACLTYSGGNKRKLSIALAFMGRPPVILLDEPTSGVDPESMQQFWNTMTAEKKNKIVSFVLCSHSMEECETLCDRIGIMKEGRIECCDTLNRLRNRYQNGFIIEVRVKEFDEVDGPSVSSSTSTSELEEEMKETFGAAAKDSHSGTMVYQTNLQDLTLDKVFGKMEAIKEKYGNFLEGYTVSQTSLEDVFLKVARAEDG